MQEEIKGGQQRAFEEEAEEEELEEEDEEEEEEQPRKKPRVTYKPHETSKFTPKASDTPKKATPPPAAIPDPPLFAFAQEITRPEIKEHFILLPCPAGLSVKVDNLESEPQIVRVQLDFSFRGDALREICNTTGDNLARTSSFLKPLTAEKKFTVPFVIDDIKPQFLEPEQLVIIRVIGKKHKLVFDIK